jgi:NAD(P)-dependent dehydrogenase (short-subunit alcohol dehydrogenase family)
MDFEGTVPLVTGGMSGSNAETASQFARSGAKVVLAGRRLPQGGAVVHAVPSAAGEAHFVESDVTREAEVKRLAEETIAPYGHLDIALKNAGGKQTRSMTDFREAEDRGVFGISVLAVFLSLKYEIPAMLPSGGGTILNTPGVVGHIAMPGVAIHIASKLAVEGITRTAALEMARQGFRVNAVARGVVATEMTGRLAGGEKQKAVRFWHPCLRRAGLPNLRKLRLPSLTSLPPRLPLRAGYRCPWRAAFSPAQCRKFPDRSPQSLEHTA